MPAAVLASAMLAACAGHDGFCLKDGRPFRVEGGVEVPLPDFMLKHADTASGQWLWLAAAPVPQGAVYGPRSGIYLFRGGSSRPCAFLPVEEGAHPCTLSFCPRGDMLLLSCGSRGVLPVRRLELYALEGREGAVKKASFAMTGRAIWLDGRHFAFNLVDEDRGSRAPGKSGLLWNSVAVCDAGTGIADILYKAGETRDYALTGFYDGKSGSLGIVESRVERARDWADEMNVEDRMFVHSVSGAKGSGPEG